jgi:hypothetical protein
VSVSPVDIPLEFGAATVQLSFSDGTTLRADYWRLLKHSKERISSFDHRQQYGLTQPIDAIRDLENEIRNEHLTDVHHDSGTGDLLLEFTSDVKLQIFGFTAYEIWEINFPNGTGEFSNYSKA